MKKCNYHTHSKRCGHAYGEDEDYILEAIKGGFKTLGFTDHTPWKYDSGYFRKGMRMPLEAFDDYYQNILRLKEKYKDEIEILIGVEAEYFPKYMDWLLTFKEKYHLDYLIFGNHFYLDDETGPYFGRICKEDEYLEYYVKTAIEGMKTGYYLYFAHPDLYMRNRYAFKEKEIDAAYRICRAAKEYDVILEYNLEGLQGKTYDAKAIGYPCLDFWKIASEVGNKVIIGVDAHNPESLSDINLYKKAYQTLKALNLEIIEEMPIK